MQSSNATMALLIIPTLYAVEFVMYTFQQLYDTNKYNQ